MSSAVQQALEPGSQFGRYQIHELIARGGMGEVWLATASGPGGFQKKVVIKTILPALAERTEYVEMLINEASLAAQLSHPNIVQVFDLGCQSGVYYIAMEYIAGRTLAQVLQQSLRQRTPVPPGIACSAIARCCDGLQYAHDFTDDEGNGLGLLHRDVSPSNVMVSHAGNVTILDFGIAVATRGEEHTQSGAIKGKYHYMAPERIRGLPANRRCDIYSLGVVFYQLLSWRRPFHGDSDFDLLRNIVHEQPVPLRDYAPWLDPDLAEVVMRAINKSPDARFPDAASFAAAIRQHLRESGVICEARDLSVYLQSLFGEPITGAPLRSAAPLPVKPAPAAPVPASLENAPPSIEVELSFSLSAPVPDRPAEKRGDTPVQPLGTPSTRRPVPTEPTIQAAGTRHRRAMAKGSSAPRLPPRPLRPSAPAAISAEPTGSPLPIVPAAPPAPAPIATEPASSGGEEPARRPAADIDIFSSSARRPPQGADLFAGYQRRRPQTLAEREEPAFVRTGTDRNQAWPFARRADTLPGSDRDGGAGFFANREPDEGA